MKLSRGKRRELTSKLKKIGFKISAEAKKLCPVDTGRLRSSIHVETEGNNIVVGSNVEYAPYQEYGTDKMPAQPYLRPAIDKVIGNNK